MTYARKMAHEAQDRWLNNGGGHAVALESVETTIKEVIERCAKEADAGGCACGGQRCMHDMDARRTIAARIRALAEEG